MKLRSFSIRCVHWAEKEWQFGQGLWCSHTLSVIVMPCYMFLIIETHMEYDLRDLEYCVIVSVKIYNDGNLLKVQCILLSITLKNLEKKRFNESQNRMSAYSWSLIWDRIPGLKWNFHYDSNEEMLKISTTYWTDGKLRFTQFMRVSPGFSFFFILPPEMFWRHVVQSRMRANGVEVPPPFFDHNPRLARQRNQSVDRYSSRNLPLKLSLKPFCHDFAGSITVRARRFPNRPFE